mmetsp:Transcript_58147/g.94504  ORF Transcript_58147/g.94504 Transcript_58147/m.94504 type:complete len:115 (+) Transcript_58147:97-441(+)
MADADAWRPVHENLRNSVGGAAMAGAGAFLGNVVAGPVAGIVGGLAGVALGAVTEEDGVESLPTTIANMTPRQRRNLAARAIRRMCFRLLQLKVRAFLPCTVLLSGFDSQYLLS